MPDYIMITDYGEKNIEFAQYDCAVDYTFLTDYSLGNIKVKHSRLQILIEFEKKDLIAAAGIFYYKGLLIDDMYKDYLETSVILDNKRVSLQMDFDIIFKKCAILTKNLLVFEIKSNSLDLTTEKGIISYYNTNDTYHNELLLNLFKE